MNKSWHNVAADVAQFAKKHGFQIKEVRYAGLVYGSWFVFGTDDEVERIYDNLAPM